MGEILHREPDPIGKHTYEVPASWSGSSASAGQAAGRALPERPRSTHRLARGSQAARVQGILGDASSVVDAEAAPVATHRSRHRRNDPSCRYGVRPLARHPRPGQPRRRSRARSPSRSPAPRPGRASRRCRRTAGGWPTYRMLPAIGCVCDRGERREPHSADRRPGLGP